MTAAQNSVVLEEMDRANINAIKTANKGRSELIEYQIGGFHSVYAADLRKAAATAAIQPQSSTSPLAPAECLPSTVNKIDHGRNSPRSVQHQEAGHPIRPPPL